MSLYRVHLKWNEKDITLRARGLDLTHPYFVSITDLVFPEQSNLIIDPSEDEVRKTFGEADHLMIPFQTVTLIEELKEESTSPEEKVRNFTVVHDSEDSPDEGDTPEPDPKNTDTGKSDSPASDPKDDSTDDHEDD